MSEGGFELAKAYVQIVPSARGIKGSIAEAMGGEAEAAGQSAGESIAKKIKAVIAAAGIGAALKSAISEGAALEQSIGGIETLFGESADRMKEYASEAYRTAGVSANQYMEQATSFAASLLSSVGGDTEAAADSANQAIIDMADNANKMGTSLDSIQSAYQGFAKQNYTMLDNLKLGYGGTKTEMERLLADASALSGVKYNIENLSDVYEAIHVIQSELGITGSTAEEAASTLSGSMGSMKAAAQDFMGNLVLGQNVEESFGALVDTASTFLFKNLLPAVGRVISAVPGVIGTALTEHLPAMIDSGMELISTMASGLQEGIPQLLEKVPEVVSSLSATLTDNFPDILFMGLSVMESLAKGFAGNLPALISALLDALTSFIQTIGANLPAMIESGMEIIGSIAMGLGKAIPEIIKALPDVIKAIIDGFKNVDWLQLGKDIINGIKDGILAIGSEIGDAVKGVVEGAKTKVKDFFGIHSPSKVFRDEIGRMLGEGMIEGILATETGITAALEDVKASAVSTFNVNAAMTAASGAGTSGPVYSEVTLDDGAIVSAIVSGVSAIVAAVREIEVRTRRTYSPADIVDMYNQGVLLGGNSLVQV
ncbi:MAG: hypothetical protein K5981_09105 [Clostridia bacterium]|nr:hypothetical protein [Clostridia bacterium]